MTPDLPSSRRTAGFTLVELLVALGLTGLIMGAVLTLNLRTNDAATTLQARTELTGEVQVAQNYIASKLRNAVYVFPYYSLASTFTLATSGYSTFNSATRAGRTGTGNYTWRYAFGTVAADPFLAFVLPPEQGNAVTAGSCAAATTNAAKQANCYAFYAYYAVPRSLLITGGGGALPTGANKLQSDGVNDTTTWALMEYRAYYATTGYGTGAGSIPTGGTGLLVLDYVRPTTETTVGTTVDKLFVASTTPVTAVTLNLAATRQVGDETVNVPGTGRYSLRVYPRNLSNAAFNN